jgi:hypothetical protein
MEPKQANSTITIQHKRIPTTKKKLKPVTPAIMTKKSGNVKENEVVKGKASDELINLIDTCLRTSVNFINSLEDVWKDIKSYQERDGLTNEQVRELMYAAARRLRYSPRMVQKILPREYKDDYMSRIGTNGAKVTNEKRSLINKQQQQSGNSNGKLELVSEKDVNGHKRVGRDVVNALLAQESVQQFIKSETAETEKKLVETKEELAKTVEMVKYDAKVINGLKTKLEEVKSTSTGETRMKFYLSDLERALIIFKNTGKRQGMIVAKDGEFKEFM